MLVACHLFFGALAGLILQERYPHRYILPACLVGSILPDIIDKPLGYIIFPEIGDGRLIAHALLGLCIIGIIALLFQRDILVAGALAGGVVLHQILDEMWKIPVNWLYPFLGPFPVFMQEGYFGWGLMRELTTPSEWFFLCSLLIMILIRAKNPAMIRIQTVLLSGTPAILLLITGR